MNLKHLKAKGTKMGKYEITCDSIGELTEVCAGLVKQGICFTADTASMKVTCTGGY